MIREDFLAYIRALQNSICTALEIEDGAAAFREEAWQRPGGGGGHSRSLTDGAVFEKGGVNISAVHGALPAGALPGAPAGGPFFAAGLSLVLHPRNPHVPTVHMNVRLFELMDTDGAVTDRWFGGGSDLTPYYVFKPDVIHFHRTLKQACDTLDLALYPRFKRHCDEYFVNKHRGNENRGVGGIFFDDLRASADRSAEAWLGFVKACGDAFLPAYLPLVVRRKHTPYGQPQIDWQEHRRGRYVEFNLVHDRGTLFGLRTGGRIESILMSLPPRAQWRHREAPDAGTPEADLLAHLAPRNWLSEIDEEHDNPHG
jgi:coproporphyrinogen III oxidase